MITADTIRLRRATLQRQQLLLKNLLQRVDRELARWEESPDLARIGVDIDTSCVPVEVVTQLRVELAKRGFVILNENDDNNLMVLGLDHD